MAITQDHTSYLFFYFIMKLNGTFLFFGKPFSSGLAFALVLIDV